MYNIIKSFTLMSVIITRNMLALCFIYLFILLFFYFTKHQKYFSENNNTNNHRLKLLFILLFYGLYLIKSHQQFINHFHNKKSFLDN